MLKVENKAMILLRSCWKIALLTGLLGLSLLVQGQEAQTPEGEEEQARGAFVKSRESKIPKSGLDQATGGGGDVPIKRDTPNPAKPGRPKPNPRLKPTADPPADTDISGPAQKVKFAPTNLGLGYTLFKRGDDGAPFRVDPANEFQTGDALFFWFEPSADGYLYIFNTTNDGQATLTYPNILLNRGSNKVRAHFPFELPSVQERNQDNWLVFDGSTGIEQVYILLSRQPLKSLPVNAKALRIYCAKNRTADNKCLVKEDVWAGIKGLGQKDQVVAAKSLSAIRNKQSTAEQPEGAAARGFGLAPKDPLPTIVFMNTAANRNILFAKLELKHN